MRGLNAMAMFVCLSVGSSGACEICQVIRYVAAPGGEWELFVSSPIQLLLTIGRARVKILHKYTLTQIAKMLTRSFLF